MGINAYVYEVTGEDLKRRTDKLYKKYPSLNARDDFFGTDRIGTVKDHSGRSGRVILRRNRKLHRGEGGTLQHWNDDLHLDYLLAIIVDGPAMAYANGYHSPDQKRQLESGLPELRINTEELSYLGIFQGDTNQLIPDGN